MKKRLDQELVSRGIVASRSKATDFIKRGFISLNGTVCTTPAQMVAETDVLTASTDLPPYVSRGGEKLKHALSYWGIKTAGKFILDIGSSTGGFADCLLKEGANQVVCVDTGTDQLHEVLRNNPRITIFEQTDIRELEYEKIFDGIVIDVSFISLTHILPLLHKWMKPETFVIALIKPQFEVGQDHINRQGIVTDEVKVRECIEKLIIEAETHGLKSFDYTPSVVKGGDGNQEYLWYLKMK